MAHPADGDLRAFLDEELAASLRQELEQHLATCAACRDRLSAIRADVAQTDALLDLLAPPPLHIHADTVMRSARRSRRWWVGIAALLALTIATIAGATVGRPYVRALVEKVRGGAEQPTASPPLRRAGQAGIAFAPGPTTDLVFEARQSSGTMRVSLADTTDVMIDPTSMVTYRVSPGGVIVHNRNSDASYSVVIPRRAAHVRITIAGRLVLEKLGPDVTSGPAATAGGYSIEMR